MFLLDTLSKMLLFAFLITSMLGVGMQSTMKDLRSLLASKGLVLRARRGPAPTTEGDSDVRRHSVVSIAG